MLKRNSTMCTILVLSLSTAASMRATQAHADSDAKEEAILAGFLATPVAFALTDFVLWGTSTEPGMAYGVAEVAINVPCVVGGIVVASQVSALSGDTGSLLFIGGWGALATLNTVHGAKAIGRARAARRDRERARRLEALGGDPAAAVAHERMLRLEQSKDRSRLRMETSAAPVAAKDGWGVGLGVSGSF